MFYYRLKEGGSKLKLGIQTPTVPFVLSLCFYAVPSYRVLSVSSCSGANTCACAHPAELWLFTVAEVTAA